MESLSASVQPELVFKVENVGRIGVIGIPEVAKRTTGSYGGWATGRDNNNKDGMQSESCKKRIGDLHSQWRRRSLFLFPERFHTGNGEHANTGGRPGEAEIKNKD